MISITADAYRVNKMSALSHLDIKNMFLVNKKKTNNNNKFFLERKKSLTLISHKNYKLQPSTFLIRFGRMIDSKASPHTHQPLSPL